MQLSMLRSCGAAAILTLAIACGGDDAGPEPLDTATRDGLCQADCERLVACQPDRTQAECMASCQAELGTWLRTDVAVDVFTCRSQLACGASDDACVTCSPTDAHRRYEAACLVGAGTNNATALTACIPAGVDCTTATTCIEAALDRAGVGF